MREGRAAVSLQRTEHWISVDLIAGACQKSAAVIAAHIVAMRCDCTGVVVDICAGRSGVENCVG